MTVPFHINILYNSVKEMWGIGKENCSDECKELKKYVRISTDERPFSCAFGECNYKCSTSSSIMRHLRTHITEYPYSCSFEGCYYRAVSEAIIQYHILKRHNILQKQILYKTQENRVDNLLKGWGYSADPEVTINASRNNCVQNTTNTFYRLDFTIANCVKAILILEVDEDQHNQYSVSCELSRMSDVRASLITAGYELPIFWIRYNPNGKYKIGSDEIKMLRPQRELALKAKLEELCFPDFAPESEVNIHYMFYDLKSKERGPKIMSDGDFPDALNECVTWCV